tara:strand:- start:1689 stop:1904 length:216 start_codon:yes stop_codon:yes gene_type:complete
MVDVHPLAQFGLYATFGWYAADYLQAKLQTPLRASMMGTSELEEKVASYTPLGKFLFPFIYLAYRNELKDR